MPQLNIYSSVLRILLLASHSLYFCILTSLCAPVFLKSPYLAMLVFLSSLYWACHGSRLIPLLCCFPFCLFFLSCLPEKPTKPYPDFALYRLSEHLVSPLPTSNFCNPFIPHCSVRTLLLSVSHQHTLPSPCNTQ